MPPASALAGAVSRDHVSLDPQCPDHASEVDESAVEPDRPTAGGVDGGAADAWEGLPDTGPARRELGYPLHPTVRAAAGAL
ncbi:hypothetical protein ACWGR4_13970 [Embleya sp. NPDC055664]